jgi:alkylhydroperoxidase family enzyme
MPVSPTPDEGAVLAWIEIVDEDQAGPELRDLYEPIVDAQTGRVDEILRIHSLHPAGLAAHTALYQSAMRSTPTLRKTEREMIALVVSKINECHY